MIDQSGPPLPTVTIGIGFLNPLGGALRGLPFPAVQGCSMDQHRAGKEHHDQRSLDESHEKPPKQNLLMYCYHNGEVLLESASRLLKKLKEGGACQR